MFLRFSKIPLRHCWRNLHRQCVSRTFCRVNRTLSNSPLCGVNQISNSRNFCAPVKNGEVKWVTIYFKKANGEIIKRRGRVGETVYDIIGADDPLVKGPEAEYRRVNVHDPPIPGFGVCGGTLSCSTCHCIFEPKDYKTPKDVLTDEELDLMGYAPGNCETSRLSCCIKITEEMEGIVINVPAYTKDQRDEFDS